MSRKSEKSFINLELFMNKRLVSRRHLLISGLVGCSAMMTGVALPSSEEPPSGYIRPGPITARGKAPGLKTQLLSHQDARTFALIFAKNDKLMAGRTAFVENNNSEAS